MPTSVRYHPMGIMLININHGNGTYQVKHISNAHLVQSHLLSLLPCHILLTHPDISTDRTGSLGFRARAALQHLFSHLQCTDCLMSGLAVMYVYELEFVSCSAPFNSNGEGSAGSLRCALLYQAIWYKARSKWKLKASSVRGSFLKADLKEANMCWRGMFKFVISDSLNPYSAMGTLLHHCERIIL